MGQHDARRTSGVVEHALVGRAHLGGRRDRIADAEIARVHRVGTARDEDADAVTRTQQAWRRVVVAAAEAGIPSPAFSSSLAYYDGLRADRLPAALVQGQRDFFGAHTYRRIDREGTFHTLWSGDRSEVSAVDTH